MKPIYEPKGRAREYSLLALNHYVGCGHACTYCYAADMARKNGNKDFHTKPYSRLGIIEALKKQAPKFACTDKRVLLCFMTDAYQPLDDQQRLTRQVLKILKQYKIPFQILTKGGMRACRDFDLYTEYDAFASTLTFIDEADSKEWEPNAATPDDRFKAIEIAKSKGITTWGSLEPVVDQTQSLDIISCTHEIVDLFKLGTLNYRKSPKPIDWREYGQRAIAMCEFYKVPYYVKDDLAKHLQGIRFENTDTRRVSNEQRANTNRSSKGNATHLFID